MSKIRWANLFSFRVWFAAFLVALIPAYLASLLWEPLGAVVFAIVGLAVIGLAASPYGAVLYCPHCRKRVKAGADRCHHCGQIVTT
jgi:hypothetical protein